MQIAQQLMSDDRLRGLMEKVLGVTQARSEFSAIVEQVQYQGDTYIISRHGKPAAAVAPIQVYEAWKQERRQFFEFIRQAQQEANLTPEEADRIAAAAVTAARTQS
jgi:prevent-host-death family protein